MGSKVLFTAYQTKEKELRKLCCKVSIFFAMAPAAQNLPDHRHWS